MRQLRLWILKEELSRKVEIEESARQKATALMAEAIVTIVQGEKEEKDERVEES